MKNILTIIFLLSLSSVYAQKAYKIEKLLDSLKIDFTITPNQIINNNLIGTDIVWAGKIDSIDITRVNDCIQIFFFCKHSDFDNVSREKIINQQLKLKNYGDGNFKLSIISSKMTMNDAIMFKTKFEHESHYILIVGKVIGVEKRFNRYYASLLSYNFYTFQK